MAEGREYSGQYGDVESEPVSPTGQYLNSAALSVGILVVFDLEEPIDEAKAFAGIENLFIPTSSRFSSIMVKDDKGVQQWRKVKVNSKDHVIFPTFPEGLNSYDECVKNYVTNLASAPLPPSRPMWQIHLIKYATSSAAATGVFKLHHALGDGFSLMGALFSSVRRADDPSLSLTFPTTDGGGGEKKQEREKTDLRRWAAALHAPVEVVINTAKDFCWSFLKSNLVKDDETPVRSDGTSRFQQMVISVVDFSLKDIKKIKAKVGGTVNDVVTGIIFYGTRLFIQASGGDAARSESEVTALVLLNTRMVHGYRTIEEMVKPKAKAPWGNHFAFLHVSIPNCTDPQNAEPLENFVVHAKKTIAAKRKSLGVFLNGHLLEVMRKVKGHEETARYMWKSLRNTSLTISNLIGPMEKISLCENPVKNFHYMVVGSPQSLTVTAVSYNGNLRVAVGAEKGFIDSDLLLSCIKKAFKKIHEAATK